MFSCQFDAQHCRWKKSPLLAAGCILVVRALAVQLGFYAHAAQAVMAERGMMSAAGGALGAPLPLTPPVLFTVTFMLLFSVVIALFKVGGPCMA
jgi:homogentisate phytyltransferase/homogentisate geranylgeranyltransferase